MRNATLSSILTLLKAELGMALDDGVAANETERLRVLVDNQQRWLAQEYDWPFLQIDEDITLTPGTGDASRYYTLPTNINWERPVHTFVLWNTYWYPVCHGIGPKEYNALSSGDGDVTPIQLNPVQRWTFKRGDDTKFEVWPLPSDAQTFRFTGQRTLTSLKTAGVYDDDLTLDLDSLLLVYYTAARFLARDKKDDSKIMLAMAEQRLNRIRAGYPSKSIVLGGKVDQPVKKVVPIVTIA